MAGRILNRRELRRQTDQAEQAGEAAPAVEAAEAAPAVKKKAKAPAAKRARPKKVPPRLCARWGVFDSGMKQVAIFDYNQRAAAEEKLADLLTKKKGTYFLQVVKEPMPEPAPVAG